MSAQSRLLTINKHLTSSDMTAGKLQCYKEVDQPLKQHIKSCTDIFEAVPLAPMDAIFQLTASYKADTYDKKVNLGVGAYR